jgi:hypothetical protein
MVPCSILVISGGRGKSPLSSDIWEPVLSSGTNSTRENREAKTSSAIIASSPIADGVVLGSICWSADPCKRER